MLLWQVYLSAIHIKYFDGVCVEKGPHSVPTIICTMVQIYACTHTCTMYTYIRVCVRAYLRVRLYHMHIMDYIMDRISYTYKGEFVRQLIVFLRNKRSKCRTKCVAVKSVCYGYAQRAFMLRTACINICPDLFIAK